jgi:hypothetical protein
MEFEYNFLDSDVDDILSGQLPISFIDNNPKYKALHKLRHDIIHKFVSSSYGVPFGERAVESFFSRSELTPYFDQLKKQTPDIIIRNNNSIMIIEITISDSDHAEARKINKYSLLVKTLIAHDFKVEYKVCVVPIAINNVSMTRLATEIGVSDDGLRESRKLMLRVNSFLERVRATPLGRELDESYHRPLMTDINLDINDHDILSCHDLNERKCFDDISDLKAILDDQPTIDITDEDDIIIEHIVDKVDGIVGSMMDKQDLNINKLIEYHRVRKTAPMRDYILTIPIIPLKGIDSSIRSTMSDDLLVMQLKAQMRDSENAELMLLAGMKCEDTECFGKVKLSHELRSAIALHGPGRKAFIKAGSVDHIASQKKQTLYYADIDMNTSDINDLMIYFSQRYKQRNLDDPDKLQGVGLDYVRICQSIYREININSLRKELNKNFIIKPTGIKGVFVIIHKGPKLRVGVDSSLIWFKVIGMVDDLKDHPLRDSHLFRSMTISGPIWHTGWTSTDSKRLTHYLRCYDKIVMSYLSYLSHSGDDLTEAYNSDKSNTLGTMICIYMEDKRCTSKMLQDVRYFVMGLLSVRQYWGDIMKKFEEPLRSNLQVHMLHKIMKVAMDQLSWTRVVAQLSKFPKFETNMHPDEIDMTKSAYSIRSPRVLTDGPVITFEQLLHEMYFCMLFNKDQDDPTHASFQILTKIIEGDNSLEEVKSTTKLHQGYRKDLSELDTIDLLISKPHKNQFSRRVIEIASKLQAKSSSCVKPGGLSHQMAAFHPEVNKTIDEFATFKSSALFPNPYLPKNHDYKAQVNPRQRCLDGVMSLLREDLWTTFDVYRKYKTEPTQFQVFKKNQVGGVREILILDIASRIKINMIETHARKICESDTREMLTHGSSKNKRFTDIQHVVREQPGRNVIVHYNFDKTRWGPSFMPIQFMYLFKPFKSLYPELFRAITMSLIQHTNKRCYYPEHLLKAWSTSKSIDEEAYSSNCLNDYKSNFIKTGSVSFINESNMGQGILHYISSLYHLAVVSLRDEVFKRYCIRHKMNPGKWSDLISSDDSYTCHAIPVDRVDDTINTFMKVQEVIERLMNIWTSRSKSSISKIFVEFNSCFIAGMGIMPVSLKFALTSVDVFPTDSFTDMVQSSYNSSRQLFENGSGLELYLISQKLNSNYCESIYHSSDGMHNDPSTVFNLTRDKIPYQLGVFPIADPVEMIMMGPECHNLRIASNNPDLETCQLMLKSYTMVEELDLEAIADLMSTGDIFSGIRPVNAVTKPDRRLKKIRNNIGANYDELMEQVAKDPLIILRRAKNINETILKTRIKVFQSSAVEAMKITDGSLYYGRVSASISAKAFRVGGTDNELKTYRECLMDIKNMKLNAGETLHVMPHTIQYRLTEFKVIHDILDSKPEMTRRSRLEPRKYHHDFMSDIQTKMSRPLSEVLEYYWGSNEKSFRTSYDRDMSIIKAKMPIIEEDLEGTLQNFNGTRRSQISKLSLLLMRLMSDGSNSIKGFLYGSTSKHYEQTALTFTRENYYNHLTARTSTAQVLVTNKLSSFYEMKCLLNYFLYTKMNSIDDDERIRDKIDINVIQQYCQGPRLSEPDKKKFMIMLLYFNLIDDVRWWTQMSKLLVVKWLKQQTKIKGKWVGDFELIIHSGWTVMSVIGSNSKMRLIVNQFNDMSMIYDMLMEIKRLFQLKEVNFQEIFGAGSYMIVDKVLIKENTEHSFDIKISNMMSPSVSGHNVSVTDNRIELMDDDNSCIISIPKSYSIMDWFGDVPKMHDFKMYGIKFTTMLRLNAFSTSFTLRTQPDELLAECLDDLSDINPEATYRFDLDVEGYEELADADIALIYANAMNDDGDTSEDYGDSNDSSNSDASDEAERLRKLFGLEDLDLSHYNPFKKLSRDDKGAMIYERIKDMKLLIMGYLCCGRTFNSTSKMILLAKRLKLPDIIIKSLEYINNKRTVYKDIIIEERPLSLPSWLMDKLMGDALTDDDDDNKSEE